ncbi:MAG: GNAT family N-acetyltransferase, partial [Paracoccaceae bacterium]
MPQSTPELTIRRARASDMPALLTFVADTYGKGAPFKHAARHAWQYEENPYHPAPDSDPSIWLALDGAKVVGEIAVQDGMLWVAGAPLPAGWIVDVMVHPEYRGLGLSHKIHDAVMQDRGVLITLTMAAATRRVAERANCLTLGPTHQFILPRRLSARTVRRFLAYRADTSKAARARLLRGFNATGIGPLMVAALGRLVAGWRRMRVPKGLPAGCRIVEVARFEPSLNHLWEGARGEFPAIFERSVEFLNWRFVDVPELVYRRFVLEQDGVPRGYLVTRVGVEQELPLGV